MVIQKCCICGSATIPTQPMSRSLRKSEHLPTFCLALMCMFPPLPDLSLSTQVRRFRSGRGEPAKVSAAHDAKAVCACRALICFFFCRVFFGVREVAAAIRRLDSRLGDGCFDVWQSIPLARLAVTVVFLGKIRRVSE